MENSDNPRTSPHSIEAEQSVLGSLLINNNTVDDIAGLLDPSDFYRRNHKLIFQVIVDLFNEQQPADVITVGERLERNNQIDDAGGNAYLIDLTRLTLSSANARHYATIVRKRALLRALIDVGNDIVKMGYNPDGREPRELTEQAEQKVFQLANQQIKTSSFRLVRSVLEDVVLTIDKLSALDSDITGIPTGFDSLDHMTSGLQNGDLIILAGRPSMGKTTLAMNIIEHAARYHTIENPNGGDRQPASIAVFSMEMDDEQLVMRLASSIGSIVLGNLRSGKLENNEYTQFFEAGKILNGLNIHIDHSSGITAFELRARARRLKREHPSLSLIVIDYLQLLHSGDGRSENRVAEITQISRLLKEMARELSVPVLVLSQLNRSVERRENKRPMMSDLRESGSIEQDADIIMFIHREEVYDNKPELKGKASLIIAKQRNGTTGDLALRFEGPFSRFVNPIHGADAPPADGSDYFPDL